MIFGRTIANLSASSLWSISSDALWTLTAQAATRGSVIVGSILLARTMSPIEFAKYTYFNIVIATFSSYAAMGLGVVVSKHFAQLAQEPNAAAARAASASLLMAIFASLAMAILLAIVPAYTLQGQLGIPKILLCIGVVAMTAHAVMSCAVSALMKFRFVAATAILAGIVNLTGCAWASYARNPLIAIMTYVAAYALQVLILCQYLIKRKRESKNAIKYRPKLSDYASAFQLSLPLFGTTLLTSGSTWLVGRLVISGEHGATAFAVLSVGLQWFSLALLLSGALSRAYLPRIVQTLQRSTQGSAELRKLVRSGLTFSFYITLAICVLVLFISHWVLRLYGPYIKIPIGFLFLFMLSAVIASGLNMLGNALVMNGNQKTWLAVTASWFAILVPLTWILRSDGAIAIAFSYTIAYGFMLLLALIKARQSLVI